MYDMEPVGESEESIIEMDGRNKGPYISSGSIDDNVPSTSEWGESSHRNGSPGEQDGHIWKTTEITIEKN